MYMPMIQVLRIQRQEDHRFKTSLSYITRPSLNNKTYVCSPNYTAESDYKSFSCDCELNCAVPLPIQIHMLKH